MQREGSVSRRVSKWLFYGAIFPLTVGFCGWQGWTWWSWASAPVQAQAVEEGTSPDEPDVGENADSSAPAVYIEIPDGTSARQIGQDLATAGLIRSTAAWAVWTRWQTLQNRSGGFLAGTYAISPTESLPAIANRIWQGDVVETSLTIPEGWSLRDIATRLDDRELMTSAAFLEATRRVSRAEYPWLPTDIFGSNGANLEGFLYPDTYQIIEGVTPEQLIDQMLRRFEDVALPLYSAQASSYTLLEWVTLASIVEKEAVVSDERSLIAAVFAKRLQEGIPLGADPTVEYALGIRQTPDQPLTLSEVSTPSPYNTYLNPGLPPSPIASPGVASLEASLNPPDTEFLYFVARYDGTHVFSRTLAEHEAAQATIRESVEEANRSPVQDSEREFGVEPGEPELAPQPSPNPVSPGQPQTN